MKCGLKKTSNVRPIRMEFCAENRVVRSGRRGTAGGLRKAQTSSADDDSADGNDLRIHL